MAQPVKLVESDNAALSRYVTAELLESGTLSIYGQDLGDAVEEVFGDGMTEYEWACSLEPAEVAALKSALGCGDDMLSALVEHFSGDKCNGLMTFFKEHGIQYGFWSRFGD